GIGLAAAVGSQVTGVAAGPLVGISSGGPLASPLLAALAGAACGAGASLAVAGAYRLARGRRGLGMGDVKLLGAMGLLLGPYVLIAYILANIAGAVVGLAMLGNESGEKASDMRLPFGPFLALSAVVAAVGGPGIWVWYLRLVGLS
ncbi:MAG: prepilin peptidase, partial [Coriobacteriia bacterium]|nr:prepilin peptidase [Coriobacteriia bacterium]